MTKKKKDDWPAAEQEALETLGFGDNGEFSEIPPICFLAREILKLQKRIEQLESAGAPIQEITPRRSYP